MTLEIPGGFKRIPIAFGNRTVRINETNSLRLSAFGLNYGIGRYLANLEIERWRKKRSDEHDYGTIAETLKIHKRAIIRKNARSRNIENVTCWFKAKSN